jgi:hypothetical protein
MTITVLKKKFQILLSYCQINVTQNCTQLTSFFLSPSQQHFPYQPQTHNKWEGVGLYRCRKHSVGNCGNELVSVTQVAKLPTSPPGYLQQIIPKATGPSRSNLLIKQVPKTWRNSKWITWTGTPESLQGLSLHHGYPLTVILPTRCLHFAPY